MRILLVCSISSEYNLKCAYVRSKLYHNFNLFAIFFHIPCDKQYFTQATVRRRQEEEDEEGMEEEEGKERKDEEEEEEEQEQER